MNNLSHLLLIEALENFTYHDSRLNRELPTADAQLTNVAYGIRKDYWGDDRDIICPLSTITTTHELFCSKEDREAIVEAVAKGFAKHQCLKLFSVKMTSTTTVKWIARKGEAITRESHHQPVLLITWSEDSRIIS